ncbi:fimbrial protein [Parabacteroides timonensis]|uniref:fimbrial protein n=1 Tax=Parabacteroides timonensis TaxID=1871013 RepID=UPI00094E0DA0|nr:fimbrial protein [Parabacteroides timonensis]
MKNRLNQYKSLPLLASLFAFIAFGCVSGERGAGGDPDLPDMLEVDLQVGISEASKSLQTKAADANALPGEQINSLVVFIVNASGKIEKKFQPDLTGDEEAKKGELTSWKSGSFEITGGPKKIYAFANWESIKDNPLENVVNIPEGQDMPSLPVSVSWESGVNDVSKTSKYLPMSVQEEWIPAKGVKTICLVRLVSRLKVKILNRTSHTITVTKLTLGKFNTAGNLFEADKYLALTEGGYSIDKPFEDNKQLAVSESIESDWYYVNESEATDGFEVELETSSDKHLTGDNPHQGTKYTALRQIPRNHFWNLNIEFTPYKLTLLAVSNENPPIGGYPESSVTSEGITDLVCTVYGGGPFTIIIEKLVSQEENGDVDLSDQVTWSIGKVDKGDLLAEAPNKIEQATMDGASRYQITGGRMVGAATKDQSSTFELIAKKDGSVLATFQIQLRFADLFELTTDKN